MRVLPLAVVTVVLATVSAASAQSNPFDGLNSRGRSYSDPALYAQHKAQWLARVQAMPENVDVLEGAADFLSILDRPLALDLLGRASALEPKNPKWVEKQARVLRRTTVGRSEGLSRQLELWQRRSQRESDTGSHRSIGRAAGGRRDVSACGRGDAWLADAELVWPEHVAGQRPSRAR
jgi:hypothetical protein